MIPRPGATVLVDTDVFSFLFEEDSRASAYWPILEGRILAISFMTLAEIELWALRRNWGERRNLLLAEFLKSFLRIPSEEGMARIWAQVVNDASRRGRPIECADAWIAAAAIFHGLPLITHNHRDFEGIPNLEIISREAG